MDHHLHNHLQDVCSEEAQALPKRPLHSRPKRTQRLSTSVCTSRLAQCLWRRGHVEGARSKMVQSQAHGEMGYQDFFHISIDTMSNAVRSLLWKMLVLCALRRKSLILSHRMSVAPHCISFAESEMAKLSIALCSSTFWTFSSRWVWANWTFTPQSGRPHFYRIPHTFTVALLQKWADEDSFPEFMVKADTSVKDELDRAAQYLNAQTQERLLRVYEKEVLVTHQQKMLAKEKLGSCRPFGK